MAIAGALASEGGYVYAAGGEFLDAVVVGVGYIYGIGGVNSDAGGAVELFTGTSGGSPCGEEGAVAVEYGDAAGVFVGDEEAAVAVLGDGGGPDELAVGVAVGAERAVVLAFDVAHSDADAAVNAVHGAVDDVEASVGGRHGVGGVVEAAPLHGGESDGEVVLEGGDSGWDGDGGHGGPAWGFLGGWLGFGEFEKAQQLFDVFHFVGQFFEGHGVYVVVLVEAFSGAEQDGYLPVVPLVGESLYDPVNVGVGGVLPSALLGYDFQAMGDGAPSLFGSLEPVAFGEFFLGVPYQAFAVNVMALYGFCSGGGQSRVLGSML